jgi:hypothetical protein
MDDDGRELIRGKRMAVCDKTFRIYTRPPYAAQITAVPPAEAVPLDQAAEFDCHGGTLRSPRETKLAHNVESLLPVLECRGASTNCC